MSKATQAEPQPLVSVWGKKDTIALSDYFLDLPDNEKTRLACKTIDALMSILSQLCYKTNDKQQTGVTF